MTKTELLVHAANTRVAACQALIARMTSEDAYANRQDVKSSVHKASSYSEVFKEIIKEAALIQSLADSMPEIEAPEHPKW